MKYIAIMRHGEADHNIDRVFDSSIFSKAGLTEQGIKEVRKSAKWLVEKIEEKRGIFNFGGIVSSPLYRTFQTSLYINDVFKESKYKHDLYLEIDYRLREIDMGKFDRVLTDKYPYPAWDFTKNNSEEIGGESTDDVLKRVKDYFDCDLYYNNYYMDTIIVSHGTVVQSMMRVLFPDDHDLIDFRPNKGQMILINMVDKTFELSPL